MPSTLHNDAYVAFVEMLISVRKDAGVTQVQLADRLGKPQSWVSKNEARKRRIDAVEFCAIAEALNRSPGELLDVLRSKLAKQLL